jgi:3-methyl-2-oxobutanoate hydroxymethyltransferase
MERKKVTTSTIINMKKEGKKIVSLTAYDFPFARILDEAGIDIILVGDSLGMVVLGYQNTTFVTLENMIHHTKAVAKAKCKAMVVADMPFLTFQISKEEAMRNAGRLITEGCAEAVKVEGGVVIEETIKGIVDAGIPVMGHVGLTPQSYYKFGGYKVQGRGLTEEEKVIEDARAVERAGAFSVVLEGIPLKLAKKITEDLSIPTIGIGAGPHCDGQVLVLHDMLGFFKGFAPKFTKRYVDLDETVKKAVEEFKDEVIKGDFPGKEQSYD